VLARAKEAAATKVVETPLFGGVLLDAIRAALDMPLNLTCHLD
jgi:hypothetical protein